MKALNYTTLALIIIGGLNWGLVGAAKFNLVSAIFGEGSVLSNIVYILVGLSAVVQAFLIFASSSAPRPVGSH